MKFGLFGGATATTSPSQGTTEGLAGSSDRAHVAQSDDSHAYGEFVNAIVKAEALGYHSIFLVEHHFTGVGQLSASLNLLTYLAAHTSTIRLGTGVIVVPWHNPVLLAEQARCDGFLGSSRRQSSVSRSR